jgi:hypothetical protein
MEKDKMNEFEGTVAMVAADEGGMALNVDMKTADGARVTGWVSIARSISREGLAVGLTALTSGKRLSVRMDSATRIATAVRVIA